MDLKGTRKIPLGEGQGEISKKAAEIDVAWQSYQETNQHSIFFIPIHQPKIKERNFSYYMYLYDEKLPQPFN